MKMPGTSHRLLLLAMSSALVFALPVGAELMSAGQEKSMMNFFQEVMKCREIPGLTMTIVRGKEMRSFPMGVAKLGGQPVKSTTLFNVGAITQSFTAALLGIIIQRSGGSITFDTPLEMLIPKELKLSSDTLTKEVTLRDLLMHRTGLTSGSTSLLAGLSKSMSREELVRHLRELPMQSPVRSEFLFNPFMYTLAAYVGEKLTTTTWENLMRMKFLDKISMTSTLVQAKNTQGSNFARAYTTVEDTMVEVDPSLYELGPLAPSGTLYTNADDMGKALRFFMGDPTFTSHVELPVGVLEEIMNPKILLSMGYRASLDRSSYHWPVKDINVGYGMGFFRNVYRGYQVAWHAGTIPGYHSIMWMLPEKSIGVFIAINGQKHSDMPLSTLQALTYYVSDVMLKEEAWINQTTGCTFPKPFMEPIEFPDLPFEPQNPDFGLPDYQGRFSSPLLGDIIIEKSTTNSKGLSFKFEKLVGELLPEGGHVFRLFLEGNHKFMKAPTKGKHPVPFLRLFFEFKGPECIGVKLPDNIFGGAPVNFVRKEDTKEEL